MPPSLAEHVDFLWYLLIAVVNILGGTLITLIVWSGRGMLRVVSTDVGDLKKNAKSMENKLDAGLQRLHGRVDFVERKVFKLIGAHDALHGGKLSEGEDEREEEL